MKRYALGPKMEEQIFTLYKNIKYLRVKHKLTIKQMASIINISEKKLIHAEACREIGCFYDKHIRNVCLYFKVSADMLLRKPLYQ